MTPCCRVVHSLLQRSLQMRHHARRAPEPHVPADIVPPASTQLARSARQSHLQRYKVPGRESCHLRADGNYATRRLMAQGQRLPHDDIAIAVVVEVVQVRAAEGRG